MSEPQSSLNKDLCTSFALHNVRGCSQSHCTHRKPRRRKITSLKWEVAELELLTWTLSMIMFSKHVKNTYSASGTKSWWKQREKMHSTTLKQRCLRNVTPQRLSVGFQEKAVWILRQNTISSRDGCRKGKMNTEPKEPKQSWMTDTEFCPHPFSTASMARVSSQPALMVAGLLTSTMMRTTSGCGCWGWTTLSYSIYGLGWGDSLKPGPVLSVSKISMSPA